MNINEIICTVPEARFVVLRAHVVQLEDRVVGVGNAPNRLGLVDGLPAVWIHGIDLRARKVLNT